MKNPIFTQLGRQRPGLAAPGQPTSWGATPLKLIGLKARIHAPRLVRFPRPRTATIGAARCRHHLIGQLVNLQ